MKRFKEILAFNEFWNFFYPLIFGIFILHPLYLFIISSIIDIHVFLLVTNNLDSIDDRNYYLLLSYIIIIAFLFVLIGKIKHKIMVKKGLRIPDNWDDEII
jgi:hypothetical protein